MSDGKGPSVWDLFTKQPGRTFQGSNGDVAVDHYHRFEEDVALMAEMGLKAYRFSVSWPRVFPRGRGEVNASGLAFYERLIDALLARRIEPILTLYHWDLPQALQDEYGGWEDRRIIDDFENYSVTLFRRFAGKVKYWVSLNEQNFNLTNAYQLGAHPPAVQDRRRFFAANHIAFLANAKVIAASRHHVPDALIGPSFAYSPAYPGSCDPTDMLAFESAEEFTNHWWLDTYCLGRYPKAALAWLRESDQAPEILPGDLEILRRGRPDFVGVNCRVGGGALARWPPSAAQTARAVFPHAAFTKTHCSGMQSKESIQPGSPARTRRTAWRAAELSSPHSASA